MNVLEAMLTRRSVRTYQRRPVRWVSLVVVRRDTDWATLWEVFTAELGRGRTMADVVSKA